jgi:hypothetical protein
LNLLGEDDSFKVLIQLFLGIVIVGVAAISICYFLLVVKLISYAEFDVGSTVGAFVGMSIVTVIITVRSKKRSSLVK